MSLSKNGEVVYSGYYSQSKLDVSLVSEDSFGCDLATSSVRQIPIVAKQGCVYVIVTLNNHYVDLAGVC
jgi:hypothetical protein